MRTAILACPTIRDELLHAHRIVQGDYEILWLKRNLHAFPDMLKAEIQKELDLLDGYDRVILGFGFCGNAIAGLKAGDFQMIIPKIDDCISMMLGSYECRKNMVDRHPTIFMTRGWMDGEKGGAWEEYLHVVKRYDPETAASVFEMMYGMHDQLVVLDTGAYPLPEILPRTKILADAYALRHEVCDAGTQYLQDVLNGPWDSEKYIIVEPYGVVEEKMLTL